jgi:hypothetical protein
MTNDPEKQRQNAEKRKINLQKKFKRRALKQGKKTGTKNLAITSKSMPDRSQPAPVVPSEPLEMIGPEDLTEEEKCNYPLWKKYLEKYPLIHSIDRRDYPEDEFCTVFLTHFYSSDDLNKEEKDAEKQFDEFFKDIGFNQEENTDVHVGPGFYKFSRTQYYDEDLEEDDEYT